jgi:hypothetical protein
LHLLRSDVPPERRNERARPAHEIHHATPLTQHVSRTTNKENKTRSMIKRNFYKSLTCQKPTKQKTMTTKSTNIKHLLKGARVLEFVSKNT